jgi:hypothetical protein
MKKVLFVAVVAICWFGGQRYLRQRAQAQAARMENADIKEGMTIGDLRTALGDPKSTDAGVEWAGGIVSAKVKGADELSEPSEIKMTADYPGRIRGQPVDAYSRMAGVQRGKAFWMEIRDAGNGEKWYAVWELDATPEHHVVSVALTRARL